MAILKPLYYAGGEYTATDDRKILASLVGSQADGTRVVGVIGSPNFLTGCMKVTAGAGGVVLRVISSSSSKYRMFWVASLVLILLCSVARCCLFLPW
jgi:hypothetical protein